MCKPDGGKQRARARDETTMETKKRKSNEPKTPEAAARKRKHQFGQPEGNKQCSQSVATSQREFYRWVETQATEKELKEYVSNDKNPYARRKFIMTIQAAAEMRDFFDLTNQTHGQPKQQIEVDNVRKLNINIFGDENV